MKKLVRKTTEANLPTKFGNFKVIAYEDYKKTPHLAIIKGNLKSYRSKASGKLKNRKFLSNKNGVLVRVHSSCLTGDALGSLRCDCGPQLEKALQVIGKKGGVLLYRARTALVFSNTPSPRLRLNPRSS